MARKTNTHAQDGAWQANEFGASRAPHSGALVQLAPERECLVKLRYAHARSEVLGLTLRFRLNNSTDIEQYDINPALEGGRRTEVQARLFEAFELLSRLESFHDGLQTMKELESVGECVGFRLSLLPASAQVQH